MKTMMAATALLFATTAHAAAPEPLFPPSGTDRPANYVAPDARFRGVSRALLGALEVRAAERGNVRCTLTSTETAHRFYRAAFVLSSFCFRRPSVPRQNCRYKQCSQSPLENRFMGTNFQIITWSLFGVLLIAYIGVKMSKRRKQS